MSHRFMTAVYENPSLADIQFDQERHNSRFRFRMVRIYITHHVSKPLPGELCLQITLTAGSALHENAIK